MPHWGLLAPLLHSHSPLPLHRCSVVCSNGGSLAEDDAVEAVVAPLLHAVHYMHSQGIVHRDIKSENILFNAKVRPRECPACRIAAEWAPDEPQTNLDTPCRGHKRLRACPEVLMMGPAPVAQCFAVGVVPWQDHLMPRSFH